MGAEENAPQTGDDALDREALDEDLAADVSRWFWAILRWQMASLTSTFMSNRLAVGDLAIDADHNGGVMLNAMLRKLWLPVRVPREGRKR